MSSLPSSRLGPTLMQSHKVVSTPASHTLVVITACHFGSPWSCTQTVLALFMHLSLWKLSVCTLTHGFDALPFQPDAGYSSLVWAAQMGNVGMVQLLVGANASMAIATIDNGSTPLYVMSCHVFVSSERPCSAMWLYGSHSSVSPLN